MLPLPWDPWDPRNPRDRELVRSADPENGESTKDGVTLAQIIRALGLRQIARDESMKGTPEAPPRWVRKPPIEALTLAADLDDHARIGGEYWIASQLALRAGLKSELGTPESRSDATTATFGVGVKHRFAELNYAYERHPVLDVTHYTSLALAYNPRVVTIKDAPVRPSPIFRALYQHYQENDFFDVVIGNSAPEPIEATVGIMLPTGVLTSVAITHAC